MDLVAAPRRDEVWLVSLDPTQGAEIQKARPCLVVSPDEMKGQVALDQLRAVDHGRLLKKLGRISPAVAADVSSVLIEMFTRE